MTRFLRQTGGTLDGRYRIDEVLPGSGTESAFLAAHVETGERAWLVELARSEADALRGAALASHPSLATLEELVELGDGRAVAVVELVIGLRLSDRQARGRPLTPEAAARLGIALADALVAIHRRGAAHGLLRPEAIIVNSNARRGPVLGYAPLDPASVFHSPERRRSGPSAADDVWALAAVIHLAILGRPPPPRGYGGAAELRDAGIPSPALAGALAACLLTDATKRVGSAIACRDALGRALATLEAQELEPPSEGVQTGTQPTVSGATVQGVGLSQESRRSSRKTPLLFAGVAMVVAVATVLWNRPQTSGSHEASSEGSVGVSPTEQPPVAPAPSAEAPARDVDLVSAEALPSDEELAACVERQFPEGSFEASPDYTWLCLTTDPRRGAARMRQSLVMAAGDRQLTPAMDIWSRLGWYGMAGFAVVRATCCPNAESASLPATEGCPRLDTVIHELVRATQTAGSTEGPIERYGENVRCQLSRGHGAQFWVSVPLAGGQDTALRRLLESRRVE